MYPKTQIYEHLREAIAKLPVIDTHDHTFGPQSAPEYKEPIASLIQGYFGSDLISAGAETEIEMLNDVNIPTEKKWPIFQKFWKRTEHTAYAKVTKIIMQQQYSENEMSISALKRISEKLLKLRDEKVYYGILKKAGIKCRLVNICYLHGDSFSLHPGLKEYIEGKYKIPDCDRMLIPLLTFHQVARSHAGVQAIAALVDKYVTNLDQFLEVCYGIFQKMKEQGAIGMKDQSAYDRVINFENVPRSEAEKLFNIILENPRSSLGWPQAKPLDDYLFHRFLDMAEKLDLPVQMHTGHMAGIRNDIVKTNAINLTSTIELHQKVQFDLFHGNWPYMGELLYLAKNFPNVHIDLCWVNIVDPYYTRHLLCDAITTVPHSKIHVFGADYGDVPEYAAAHLEIARDVTASALAEMVERQWIGEGEAKEIAADWFFNNPNEFFNLGFKSI